MKRGIKISALVFIVLIVGFFVYLQITRVQVEMNSFVEEIPNQTDFIKMQNIQAYTESIKRAFAVPYNGSKIVFDPSISSLEEKNELSIKILQPYIDFKNETTKQLGFKPQLFLVHKNSSEESRKNAGYIYRIEEIYNNGESGMWLEGKSESSLYYWSPQCMGDCKFSDAYKKKYPEVVDQYNRINKE